MTTRDYLHSFSAKEYTFRQTLSLNSSYQSQATLPLSAPETNAIKPKTPISLPATFPFLLSHLGSSPSHVVLSLAGASSLVSMPQQTLYSPNQHATDLRAPT